MSTMRNSGISVLLAVLWLCAPASLPAQTFTTVFSFDGGNGIAPLGLVQATDGNLYGTTSEYGSAGAESSGGTIFKITPSGTLTTLFTFNGESNNDDGGVSPSVGLIQGTDGNFYGTTQYGGANSYGTVFKITPSGTLTTLHSFHETDGESPLGGLIQATDGNFYGTTQYGGAHSCTNFDGTVFSCGNFQNHPQWHADHAAQLRRHGRRFAPSGAGPGHGRELLRDNQRGRALRGLQRWLWDGLQNHSWGHVDDAVQLRQLSH